MAGPGSEGVPIGRRSFGTHAAGESRGVTVGCGKSTLLRVRRDFAVGVLRCNDMNRCLGMMLDGLLRLLHADTGGAFTLDPELGVLAHVTGVGMTPHLQGVFDGLIAGQRIPGGRSGRRIRYLADSDGAATADELAAAGIEGLVLVRISAGEKPLGWLVVALRDHGVPSASTMREASQFVSYAQGLLESVHTRQIRLDAALELQLAAEGTGIATWEVDLTRRRVIVSDRAREIHGLGNQPLHTVREALAGVFPPDRRGLVAAILRAVRTRTVVSHEFRSAAGRWIGMDVRVYAAPAVIMLGISRDISTHKRREMELAGTGSRLREMVERRTRELEEANTRMNSEVSAVTMAMEGSSAGMWHLDVPTGRVRLDAACCELYGLPQDEELTLDRMIRCIHPDSRGILFSRLSETLMPHGESDWDHEFLIDHPVRGQRWLSGRGRVFRDLHGITLEMVGLNIDITELKEAETILRGWNAELERQVESHTRELSESEARFRILANAIADGVVVSQGGVIVDVNSQITEMFGYTTDDVRGRSVLDFVAPESIQDVTASLAANRDDVFEWTGLRRDGSRIPVESRARMCDWGGHIVRIGVVRDLSESKRIDAELAALRGELDQSRKLALMGEVSAGIVHQISQPLSAVGGNLAALRSRIGTCAVSCRDVADLVEEAAATVARMRELITHIRKIAGPRVPVLAPIQLNPVVLDMLPLLRIEADARQIAIHLKLAHDLPNVMADVSHVSQMLVHLVRSAMEEAGLARSAGWIEVETHRDGAGWVVLGVGHSRDPVSDDGWMDSTMPTEPARRWLSELTLRFCRAVAHSHHGRFEEVVNPSGQAGGFRVIFPLAVPAHTKV